MGKGVGRTGFAAVVVGVLLGLAAPVRGQEATVIRGVRVFDGARVIPSATVVIRGGRIAAVGPGVDVPPDAEVVEGAGRTLLPGLIDAHTHTFAPQMLEAALAFGVTAQLDMFTPPALAARWRAEQEAGGADTRADLFSAGIVATAPGGHGTEYGFPIPTIAAPEAAQAFVDARIAEGSDYIKIIYDDGAAYGVQFPTLDVATLRAVVAAAHARGKLAVVHIATLRDAREAVVAGADGLAHLWVDSVPGDALIREMRARDVFVIPTLTVLESVTGRASGAALVDDARMAPFLGPEQRQQLMQHFPRNPAAPASFDAARESLARLAEAGVRILAGTDAPNPGTTHGASIHRELELLVAAGLPPVEALRAATAAPAAAFGLEERGRIAPGRRADLLLVEGDPTTDITATRAIVRIWKAGRAFDREGYRHRAASRPATAAREASAPAAIQPGGAIIGAFDHGALDAPLGRGWVETTDALMGGRSTAVLDVVAGGAAGTSHALRITGEIAAGLPFAWGGAMFVPGERPMAPVDLSAVRGLRFHARGDGGRYRVLLFTRKGGQAPAVRSFTADSTWREYAFAWSDFNGSDGSDVMAIAIVGGPTPGPYTLWIDQVTLH
ncbi:MAG TPA: CIA30 family protein [Longimicrobiales bacterium]